VLLAALLRDPEARARVIDALRGEGEVYTCRFACDLPARMRTRPPDALILTPVDEAGTDVAPMVRALRRDYPAMPMAVLAPLTPQATGHVVELARAGIDEVILRGHDDVGVSVRALLSRAGSRSAVAAAMRALERPAPAPADAILAYCLEHARESLTVDGLAAALGVDRKTLFNRLTAGALPPPSVLISWCRLFIAAQLLEDEMRTVEQVALALGFGSGKALRNMFRRYTGLRPAEVRRRGGLRCVAALFPRGARRQATGRDAPAPFTASTLTANHRMRTR
jgi:AraC-like DNA-binding protein